MLVQLCALVCLAADPIATSFTWPVSPKDDYSKSQEMFDLLLDHGYHFGEDWNLKIPPGVNVNSDMGKPVYCIAAGRVVRVNDTNEKNSWGKVIVVAHTLPNLEIVYSVYAHLQNILVALGSETRLGQKIGTIGNANGYYTAARNSSAHLHFAIMNHGPFPPNVRGYEAQLAWDTVDDYYIPSLFISNRQTPLVIRLSSGSWKKFTVDAQAPVSTAYVEVTSLVGNKQYYSLKEALTNGTLKPVIRRGYWDGWEEVGPEQLDDFIFDPFNSIFTGDYALRANLYSIVYTVKLVLFPLLADEKMMALRAKSDFLWSAHAYGPQFIRPLTETFWFVRLTWDDGSTLGWLGAMTFDVTPEVPFTTFHHLSGRYEVPLLDRRIFRVIDLTNDFVLPAISPNKVD